MSGENKDFYAVLVWGPPCSGKTINLESIKHLFNCTDVIDDPSPFGLGVIKTGRVLVLANNREVAVERKGEPRQVFVPDEAYPIATVKGLLGDKWIEPVRGLHLNYEQAEVVADTVNATLRELVFFDHHVQDKDCEQAADVLQQVRLNLDFLEAIFDAAAAPISIGEEVSG